VITPGQRHPDDDDQLKVVPLFEHSELLDRIRSEPGHLRLLLAPIVDLRRGAVAGYEALLAHGDEAPARPADWSGRVHDRQAGAVEAALVETALAARHTLPADAVLAIGVSARALGSEELRDVLVSAGTLTGVVLVVSRESGEEDPVASREALELARHAGAAVGVDETGSGSSSLRQLLRLRPDFVRIGPDFVREVDRDQAKAAVVEALAALASRIDARIVASGIVGAPELNALKRMGVPLGQGPMFGTPGPEPAGLVAATAKVVAEAPAGPDPDRTVAALVEAMPALRFDAGLEDLADAFLADPRNDVVVLVDERSRPLALAERAALLRGENYERPVMRITARSPLKAVARRAAARPVLERYHPLVGCDRGGVYQGIVRIESLLDALAV